MKVSLHPFFFAFIAITATLNYSYAGTHVGNPASVVAKTNTLADPLVERHAQVLPDDLIEINTSEPRLKLALKQYELMRKLLMRYFYKLPQLTVDSKVRIFLTQKLSVNEEPLKTTGNVITKKVASTYYLEPTSAIDDYLVESENSFNVVELLEPDFFSVKLQEGYLSSEKNLETRQAIAQAFLLVHEAMHIKHPSLKGHNTISPFIENFMVVFAAYKKQQHQIRISGLPLPVGEQVGKSTLKLYKLIKSLKKEKLEPGHLTYCRNGGGLIRIESTNKESWMRDPAFIAINKRFGDSKDIRFKTLESKIKPPTSDMLKKSFYVGAMSQLIISDKQSYEDVLENYIIDSHVSLSVLGKLNKIIGVNSAVSVYGDSNEVSSSSTSMSRSGDYYRYISVYGSGNQIKKWYSESLVVRGNTNLVDDLNVSELTEVEIIGDNNRIKETKIMFSRNSWFLRTMYKNDYFNGSNLVIENTNFIFQPENKNNREMYFGFEISGNVKIKNSTLIQESTNGYNEEGDKPIISFYVPEGTSIVGPDEGQILTDVDFRCHGKEKKYNVFSYIGLTEVACE